MSRECRRVAGGDRVVASVRPGGRLAACLLVALAVLAGLAESRAFAQAPPAGAVVEAGYDLARDEALGGHTLARHVGRTDAQLAERLRREPQISAASTYADHATASRVVAEALDASRDRVDAWARRQGRRPNLVLNYVSRDGPPIGRSMRRNARVAVPCDRAIVVLRWHERMRRWYVLTSYPEARR
jgi:hypothetical protein